MRRKLSKREGLTKKDLTQILGVVGGNISSKIDHLGSGIKSLDLRISKLESYLKEGFESLDHKIENVDTRLSYQIEGLGRRIDDFADNKISRMAYKELENRVVLLESKILTKTKRA
ncbi:MAG: hypothetical protein V4699_03115 [Patescibacteria group bacterium]